MFQKVNLSFHFLECYQLILSHNFCEMYHQEPSPKSIFFLWYQHFVASVAKAHLFAKVWVHSLAHLSPTVLKTIPSMHVQHIPFLPSFSRDDIFSLLEHLFILRVHLAYKCLVLITALIREAVITMFKSLLAHAFSVLR